MLDFNKARRASAWDCMQHSWLYEARNASEVDCGGGGCGDDDEEDGDEDEDSAAEGEERRRETSPRPAAFSGRSGGRS